MRVHLALPFVALVGCARVLGIDDPRVGGDAGTVDGDRLEFVLNAVTIAKQQRTHLSVRLVHRDGSVVDATSSVTLAAQSTSVATTGLAGEVTGVGPGTTTLTASAGTAQPAMMTLTVSSTSCHLVINEVQVAGASASYEWVEIYNPCTTPQGAGYGLRYRAKTSIGVADSAALVTITDALSPGSYWLAAGPGYNGTTSADAAWAGGSSGQLAGDAGGLGLRAGTTDTDPLIDAVTYGTVDGSHPFTEVGSAPAMNAGQSVSRTPFDGNDSDHGNTDFVLTAKPTPRAANTP